MLFCSTGKDRTGVVVGVLQSALGVEDADIARDYAATEERIPDWYFEHAEARSRRAGFTGHYGRARLAAPPWLMLDVLDAVRARHGDAARFLIDHGLKPEDLDAIRGRLTA